MIQPRHIIGGIKRRYRDTLERVPCKIIKRAPAKLFLGLFAPCVFILRHIALLFARRSKHLAQRSQLSGTKTLCPLCIRICAPYL